MEADDEKVWARYAKGVKPFAKQERQAKEISEERISVPQKTEGTQTEALFIEKNTAVSGTEARTPPTQARLDERVERNLKRGDVIIEGRLDLHGLTLQEAYEASGRFVARQKNLGKRLVLVITGKSHESDVTLRGSFPRWCDEPSFAQHILAIRSAAPHHGGDGAWYVFLRRNK